MTEEVICFFVFLKFFEEFFNRSVQKVMNEYGVNHFKTPTKTPWKASLAERAIRTLKTRLWRWFQHSKKNRWIDVLDSFVENYNETPHSSIGMAPNDVTNDNREEVYKRLFPADGVKIDCKHKIGDLVRIKIEKELEKKFFKGYTANWSEEIYVITSKIQSQGVCWYKLSDQSGKVQEGIYYSEQLNLVSRK